MSLLTKGINKNLFKFTLLFYNQAKNTGKDGFGVINKQFFQKFRGSRRQLELGEGDTGAQKNRNKTSFHMLSYLFIKNTGS